MSITITLTMAAAAALINIWLFFRVSQVRTSEKISVGDGGNENVIRRMRAQANFIEYTPIILILIAAIEISGGASTWLWAIGALFMFGRIGHAIGMDGGSLGKGRMIGTIITLLTMLILAIWAIYLSYTV